MNFNPKYTFSTFKLLSQEKTSRTNDSKNILIPVILDSQTLPDVYNSDVSKLKLLPKIHGEWSAEAEERCTICWKKIDANSEMSACPYCKRNFHRSHWIEWIKSRQFCPACRRKVSIQF